MSTVLEQYKNYQSQYPDFVILFQIGDFFEIYFDLALSASKEFDLQIAMKGKRDSKNIPSCGFPKHTLKTMVAKMLKKNKKIVLVEEVEKRKESKNKVPIIKRGITEIITPATVTEEEFMSEENANYLVSLTSFNDKTVVSYLDVSVGEWGYHVETNVDILHRLSLLKPNEIIIPKFINNDFKKYNFGLDDLINKIKLIYPNKITYHEVNTELQIDAMNDLCPDKNLSYEVKLSFATIFNYINRINSSLNIDLQKESKSDQQVCFIDKTTLNIIESQQDKVFSLRSHLDYTLTPLGKRKLSNLVLSPSMNIKTINARLNLVEFIKESDKIRENIISTLKQIKDIVRIGTRVNNLKINIKDLQNLPKSIEAIYKLLNTISKEEECTKPFWYLKTNDELLNNISELHNFLLENLNNEEVVKISTLEPDIVISNRFSAVIADYKERLKDCKDYIKKLEIKYQNQLQADSLSIAYYPMNGFVVEAKKIKNDLGQDFNFRNKKGSIQILETKDLSEQTFLYRNICEQLAIKQKEEIIEISEKLKKFLPLIKILAKIVAEVDVVVSLGIVAKKYNYVKPNIKESQEIIMIDGFHPILQSFSKKPVINNNLLLNEDKTSMMLLGSNMSGKSTFLRQVALIQIMAQIGSFVPCKNFTSFPVDKVLSRIGSGDDIYNEKSTFFVEMEETAFILKEATEKSLCIIDEIGRGTTNEEGTGLATAITKFLLQNNSYFILSTHYYQMLDLLRKEKKLIKAHMESITDGSDVKFTYKIIEEEPKETISHALFVAKKADIPKSVIDEAEKIVHQLQEEI